MSDKYLELYTKYIKGHLNVNGVLLQPLGFDHNQLMVFEVTNPNDVSYSYVALSGFVNESMELFQKLLGSERDVRQPRFQSPNDDESLYINEELLTKIKNYLKTVTTLKLGSHEIHMKPIKVEIEITKDEGLLIRNYVKPLKTFLYTQNRGRGKSEIEFTVERYQSFQKQSKYDETEYSYPLIDEILEGEIALVDNEWMVEYVKTEFIGF
tara:strand:- start:50 stop:679 length:630 start_codon:yes stop_codon:yes gene_type:complete